MVFEGEFDLVEIFFGDDADPWKQQAGVKSEPMFYYT